MPDMERHTKRAQPIVLGLLTFFAFIELVLTGVIVSYFNNNSWPSAALRDQSRFLLFVSVWTFLLTPIYIFGLFKSPGSFIFSIASHAVFLAITWLFWLAGAAAITNTLGGVLRCSSVPALRFCNQLNASEAFAWLSWVVTTFALAAVSYAGFASARSGNGFGAPLVTV